MKEDTRFQYPETKEERAELVTAGARGAVEEMGHNCGNPNCAVVKAMATALVEVTEMGLIEWRRCKRTGEIQSRFMNQLAQLMVEIAFQEAAEMAQPAVMASARF